jgi:ATPases with chaperone activity, ATP-binding subunit
MSNKDYKFSDVLIKVLYEAEAASKKMKNRNVESQHLLFALSTYHKGVAYRILTDAGMKPDNLMDMIRLVYDPEAGDVTDNKKYSSKLEKIIEDAYLESKRLGAEVIGTGHILIAILKNKDCAAYKLIKSINLDTGKMYIDAVRSCGLGKRFAEQDYKLYKAGRGNASTATPMLDKFARNMSGEAAKGRLDPVIGRRDEILRVMQILSRRMKNNVCLVGEPGVGKTAVVEGLALLIEEGNVPDNMKDKKIYQLDISGMVAGSRYRGDFEERIRNLINEVKRNDNIIIFIDELHSIIGAGGAEGTTDASNILKPALSRGEIRVIGATTLGEYRKHIEKDAALERRFQPVSIEEPDREETIEILRGVKAKYEDFHEVKISDEAVVAAVDYSTRYINDRFQPDKAIDLIDEAAAKKKLGSFSGTFKKMKDGDEITPDYEKLITDALADGDFDAASELRNEMLSAEEAASKKKKRQTKKQDINVEPEDVAEIVSVWTKVPVAKISQSEQQKLLKLEDILHKRIIGQDEAVSAVSKSLKRSRVGLKDPKRPIGSFLFLGPTGVGKTELSKALAEALFGDEKNMIRVDMSEYMEKHSVSKMIGSPPGYVGYDEGGQLSDRVRKNPYSVILFDEIEKAHPDVFNVLLQVLDDGVITDSKGRRVDFKNTIIIMTSNIGASKIIEPKTLGFVTDGDDADTEHDKMKESVMEEVKRLFKPEFLNRLDEIIVFRSLTEANVKDIAGLLLSEMKKRAEKNMNIHLSYGVRVKDYIFKKGYDRKFGARPLKRTIQSNIEDPLAEQILEGLVQEGDKVTISVKKDEIFFNKK